MNNNSKTNQLFRLIMLLSRGRYLTPKIIAEELGIDGRTIYRYIDEIKDSPFFKIEQRGKGIRLSPESLFLTSIMNSMYLSEEEAQALVQLLGDTDPFNQAFVSLKRKAHNVISNYVAPISTDADVILAENTGRIQSAIDNQRLCLLRGYTSLHSETKTDRLVEPFLFLGNKNDVRCYELSSQMNKTFKVSRCDAVEVLDVSWQFGHRHKQMYTDIFHFSDETKTRVRLLLGTRSKTIFVEEHPEAEKFLIPHPDGRWMLDADFCSMKGIGRFYLGLFEDIEIVDSPEFSQYLTERIKDLTKRI